jgi:hypothetical protein
MGLSWEGWFILLFTPVSCTLLTCWYWYTCHKIDQQYRDRQDDE